MNNIVFMGTPDFAAESLRALYTSGFSVSAVFCQPDRPKNRGMKLTACPVKQLALEHGTPVYQPNSLNNKESIELMHQLHPELIVAVAYGKLLPPDILSAPSYGCINIHGSLLPKYRGAAPIQWTILNGDKKAAVTAMYMSEALDSGDIIDSRETDVLPYETAGELFERLAPIGGELLVNTVQNIFAGTAGRFPQQESAASYAPPLNRNMSAIQWDKSCESIICQIHGLNPWPSATAVINGINLKIHRAVRGPQVSDCEPGSVVGADSNGIVVACSDGSVCITELQAPGGKKMKASDYLRGHPICL